MEGETPHPGLGLISTYHINEKHQKKFYKHYEPIKEHTPTKNICKLKIYHPLVQNASRKDRN